MTTSPNGVVSFKVDGADYFLLLDINAICLAEDRLGMDAAEIISEFRITQNVSFQRTLFWAGLQERHAPISEHDVGRMMQGLGGKSVRALLTKAFIASFPPEDAEGAAGPREAATA